MASRKWKSSPLGRLVVVAHSLRGLLHIMETLVVNGRVGEEQSDTSYHLVLQTGLPGERSPVGVLQVRCLEPKADFSTAPDSGWDCQGT